MRERGGGGWGGGGRGRPCEADGHTCTRVHMLVVYSELGEMVAARDRAGGEGAGLQAEATAHGPRPAGPHGPIKPKLAPIAMPTINHPNHPNRPPAAGQLPPGPPSHLHHDEALLVHHRDWRRNVL